MDRVLATERFAALMSEPEEDIDLDEACLLISARAHPHADPDAVVSAGLEQLDTLAEGCGAGSVDDVRHHLFGTMAFRGDILHYSDPRNSYLDEVIVRRAGIPITLAVLMIEVGRRVGLDLDPVGMPGHFLVGIGGGAYVDAFDAGRVLDVTQCCQKFVDIAGDPAAWSPDLLEPVGPHAVLARILANLRHAFLALNDLTSLDWVFELRASIPGVPVRERAERASVLATLGRVDEAARELEQLADVEERGGAGHPSVGPAPAGAQVAEELRRRAVRLRAQLN